MSKTDYSGKKISPKDWKDGNYGEAWQLVTSAKSKGVIDENGILRLDFSDENSKPDVRTRGAIAQMLLVNDNLTFEEARQGALKVPLPDSDRPRLEGADGEAWASVYEPLAAVNLTLRDYDNLANVLKDRAGRTPITIPSFTR